eukprot:6637498-Pyramimonas_sp.AAC.1
MASAVASLTPPRLLPPGPEGRQPWRRQGSFPPPPRSPSPALVCIYSRGPEEGTFFVGEGLRVP